MPKKSFQRYFEDWLATNASRFKHPPVRIRRNGNSTRFQFQGITPMITAGMNQRDFYVTVTHRDECCDLLLSLDIKADKTSNGRWTCRLCLPDYRLEYPTRAALFAAHQFESFLEWANTMLIEGNVLVLEGREGFTCARIMSQEKATEIEQLKDANWMVEIFPVFC